MPIREIPSIDRISTLPDPLLCHILSFLPTKLAVSTMILSKRWMPLWLSVPTLDFDDESFCQNSGSYACFLRFVNAVMLSRDWHLPIKRFRLKCVSSSLCDPSHISVWVNAAIQRRVEHLELELPIHTINLPPSVLKSTTLVVLKVSRLTINVLPSVSFPSLKILHWKWVRHRERHYLGKLLTQCPILEDLQIISVEAVSPGEFKTLSKLVRANIYAATFPLERVSNGVPKSFNSPAFQNLTQMELKYLFYCWDWLMTVLKDCPKLQILVIGKISRRTDSDSDDSGWVYPQFVPECLSSCLGMCSVMNYRGLVGELQFARYILENAKQLQTMTIYSSRSSEEAKVKMAKGLCLCPRSSATCKLFLFDNK